MTSAKKHIPCHPRKMKTYISKLFKLHTAYKHKEPLVFNVCGEKSSYLYMGTITQTKYATSHFSLCKVAFHIHDYFIFITITTTHLQLVNVKISKNEKWIETGKENKQKQPKSNVIELLLTLASLSDVQIVESESQEIAQSKTYKMV